MKRTESTANLANALSLAQGEFGSAKKDAANPFFKSKYADLNSIMDVIREPLFKNGLSIMQIVHFLNEQNLSPVLTTELAHKSGEFISGTCPIICAKQNDPQAFGSAVTYMKRYALQSMLGISADEDDDGERAMVRDKKPVQNQIAKPVKPVEVPVIREVTIGGVTMSDAKFHELMIEKIEAIETHEDLLDFKQWKESNRDAMNLYRLRSPVIWKNYNELIAEKETTVVPSNGYTEM